MLSSAKIHPKKEGRVISQIQIHVLAVKEKFPVDRRRQLANLQANPTLVLFQRIKPESHRDIPNKVVLRRLKKVKPNDLLPSMMPNDISC